MGLEEAITDVRNAGTPLVVVTTSDQLAAMAAIANSTNGAAKVAWDMVRGVRGLNPAGVAFCAQSGSADDLRQLTANPQAALELAERLPDDGIFFMVNIHRIVSDAFVSTGLLNLREPFKASGRTLIGLATQVELPVELRQDVVVIDDPLPDDGVLRKTTTTLLDINSVTETAENIQRAVDAIRGLSAFRAEQEVAMACRKAGIDLDQLWDRKRAAVEQVKGLSLVRAKRPTVDDIGGNAAIVEYGRRIMEGRVPPGAIFLFDEIEKYLAGSSGATANSVDADYLGVSLREMEDRGHDGIILVSPPGCGKTMFARALAATYGVPLIQFDFGAMKGRFVGDSEAAVREAFKVANAIANGRALVLATCNRLDALPPELRRRYTYGISYFDLPDNDEKRAIWRLQLAAHELEMPTIETFANDDGWTGAEIRNCCRIASRLNISVKDAAAYIVPVSQSDPKSIEALRTLAEGRFLSANYPGTYSRSRTTAGGRKLRLSQES